MWLDENERRVYFDCKVVETGSQVISGAYVELHSIKSTKGSNQTTSVSTPATSASGSEMAADKIFNEMSIKLKDNPELAKSINAVYAFQITKNNSTKIFCKKNIFDWTFFWLCFLPISKIIILVQNFENMLTQNFLSEFCFFGPNFKYFKLLWLKFDF